MHIENKISLCINHHLDFVWLRHFLFFCCAHLAQVCFGASVPNTIIKPERKLCGITCVSSVLPVCNPIQKAKCLYIYINKVSTTLYTTHKNQLSNNKIQPRSHKIQLSNNYLQPCPFAAVGKFLSGPTLPDTATLKKFRLTLLPKKPLHLHVYNNGS